MKTKRNPRSSRTLRRLGLGLGIGLLAMLPLSQTAAQAEDSYDLGSDMAIVDFSATRPLGFLLGGRAGGDEACPTRPLLAFFARCSRSVDGGRNKALDARVPLEIQQQRQAAEFRRARLQTILSIRHNYRPVEDGHYLRIFRERQAQEAATAQRQSRLRTLLSMRYNQRPVEDGHYLRIFRERQAQQD